MMHALLLALAVVLPGKAKVKPVIEPQIIEGEADATTLWLRDRRGQVVAFDRATGDATKVADVAFDLTRGPDGRLLAGVIIGSPTRKDVVAEVVNIATRQPIAPRAHLVHDVPLAVVDMGEVVFIVARKNLLKLDGERWTTVPLGKHLDASVVSTAIAFGTTILIGFNHGEFGGPPYRIDTSTGAVKELTTTKGERIMPVTGLAVDHESEGCALIAVGLEHFSSTGAVVRYCDKLTETIFMRGADKRVGDHLERALGLAGSYPMFGLMSQSNGWVAPSRGKLFRSVDTIIGETALPTLSPWHGLVASFDDPDFILVMSSMNGASSLGGDAPVLVPVRH